ncbi:MAG: hypothetical protein WC043_07765 [Pseudobdellovibrionaceae bacterium]
MKNRNNEQVVCDFIEMTMNLRTLVKHENAIILQKGEFKDYKLISKKIQLLKFFSEEAPKIMDMSRQSEDISDFLKRMLVDVLRDVRHHLKINTNLQIAGMKKCLERIERVENIRTSIIGGIQTDGDGWESCH